MNQSISYYEKYIFHNTKYLPMINGYNYTYTTQTWLDGCFCPAIPGPHAAYIPKASREAGPGAETGASGCEDSG